MCICVLVYLNMVYIEGVRSLEGAIRARNGGKMQSLLDLSFDVSM